MADQNTQPSPTPPPRASSGFPALAITVIATGAVVLILLIMAGSMLVARAKAQEAARRASCMGSICQIRMAMLQYADDHDNRFMPLVDIEGKVCPVVFDRDGAERWDTEVLRQHARSGFALLLKEGYLTTTMVFICPSSGDRMPPDTFPTDFEAAPLKDLLLGENNCSYGWDPTKKHTADATCAILAEKPRKTPGKEGTVANNSQNHNDKGQNISYNDGHVKWATTPKPDAGDDPDIYTGSVEPGKEYWKSTWDAKIIR